MEQPPLDPDKNNSTKTFNTLLKAGFRLTRNIEPLETQTKEDYTHSHRLFSIVEKVGNMHDEMSNFYKERETIRKNQMEMLE